MAPPSGRARRRRLSRAYPADVRRWRRFAKRQPRHLARHVVRREVAVDRRHLELAVPEDLLKREQIAAGHNVVAGEGVAHRVPRTHRDVAAGRAQQVF